MARRQSSVENIYSTIPYDERMRSDNNDDKELGRLYKINVQSQYCVKKQFKNIRAT